jgi:hypothetical protein
MDESVYSNQACNRIDDAVPQRARPAKVRMNTSEYKVTPLKKAARELLGYPHPRQVPRGVYAEQAIAPDAWNSSSSGLRGDGEVSVCRGASPRQRRMALGARPRPAGLDQVDLDARRSRVPRGIWR